MTSLKKLVRALTDEIEGGYQITLEADDGQVFRVFATEDQLSALADDFDELLALDDATPEDEEEEPVGESQPS